jgi:hypothetical protein
VNLLLILGAGASRNLGKDGPMPLMADWSAALSEALDLAEEGLSSACHLTPGLSGPEFEENLGLLLKWEQVRDLEERFQQLGGQTPNNIPNGARDARSNQARRMAAIKSVVNRTLYEQFGQQRIDDAKSVAAYKALLKRLGDPELIVATTNYDRAAETALETLGRDVSTGFSSAPRRTPVLEPEGLVLNRGPKTPVIHLHGAVGWYREEDPDDNTVKEHPADLRYNDTLGIPVVLYPNPDKDPTSDATVSRLWSEFHSAVDLADRILVMGHSLHDPALVKALEEASRTKDVVVTYIDPAGEKAIATELPNALAIELEFGPKIKGKWPLEKLVEEAPLTGKRVYTA